MHVIERPEDLQRRQNLYAIHMLTMSTDNRNTNAKYIKKNAGKNSLLQTRRMLRSFYPKMHYLWMFY